MGGSSPVSLLSLGDTPTTLPFLPKPLSPVTMTLDTNSHSRSEKGSGERGGGGSYPERNLRNKAVEFSDKHLCS